MCSVEIYSVQLPQTETLGISLVSCYDNTGFFVNKVSCKNTTIKVGDTLIRVSDGDSRDIRNKDAIAETLRARVASLLLEFRRVSNHPFSFEEVLSDPRKALFFVQYAEKGNYSLQWFALLKYLFQFRNDLRLLTQFYSSICSCESFSTMNIPVIYINNSLTMIQKLYMVLYGDVVGNKQFGEIEQFKRCKTWTKNNIELLSSFMNKFVQILFAAEENREIFKRFIENEWNIYAMMNGFINPKPCYACEVHLSELNVSLLKDEPFINSFYVQSLLPKSIKFHWVYVLLVLSKRLLTGSNMMLKIALLNVIQQEIRCNRKLSSTSIDTMLLIHVQKMLELLLNSQCWKDCWVCVNDVKLTDIHVSVSIHRPDNNEVKEVCYVDLSDISIGTEYCCAFTVEFRLNMTDCVEFSDIEYTYIRYVDSLLQCAVEEHMRSIIFTQSKYNVLSEQILNIGENIPSDSRLQFVHCTHIVHHMLLDIYGVITVNTDKTYASGYFIIKPNKSCGCEDIVQVGHQTLSTLSMGYCYSFGESIPTISNPFTKLSSAKQFLWLILGFVLEIRTVVSHDDAGVLLMIGELFRECIKPLISSQLYFPICTAASAEALCDCPLPVYIGIYNPLHVGLQAKADTTLWACMEGGIVQISSIVVQLFEGISNDCEILEELQNKLFMHWTNLELIVADMQNFFKKLLQLVPCCCFSSAVHPGVIFFEEELFLQLTGASNHRFIVPFLKELCRTQSFSRYLTSKKHEL